MFEKLSGRSARILDQENAASYAVIAPFIPSINAFLFEVRSLKLRKQPGEVCFPGGFIEAGESPKEAGRRELSEELCIPIGAAHIIAPLDILITPYNTIIYPFLGYLDSYQFTFSKEEVHAVFTVPFDFFLSTKPQVFNNTLTVQPDIHFPYDLVGGKAYQFKQGSYPVPFYQYQNHIIWGMTARIMQNVVKLYQSA